MNRQVGLASAVLRQDHFEVFEEVEAAGDGFRIEEAGGFIAEPRTASDVSISILPLFDGKFRVTRSLDDYSYQVLKNNF